MISATGKRTPHWKWLKIKTCVILCSNEPKGSRLVYWSNHIIGEAKFIHTFGLLTSEHWVHPFKVTKWLLEIQAPPVDTNFWPKTSSLQPSLIERKSFPETTRSIDLNKVMCPCPSFRGGWENIYVVFTAPVWEVDFDSEKLAVREEWPFREIPPRFTCGALR